MTQKKQWQMFAVILGVGTVILGSMIRWGGLASRAPQVPSQSVTIKPQPQPQRATPAPQEAVLPFNGRENGAAGASTPNFGAPSAGAGIPNFGSGSQEGVVPFANSNQVASAAPFDNGPSGGAGLPSFGAAAGITLTPTNGPTRGGALMPVFIQDPTDTSAVVKQYLMQICGDRVPTLQDWQKLVEMKLPDANRWIHTPIGQGHFVMCMCLDQQKNLWVGTEGEGLYRFSPKDGMWTQFVATKTPLPNGSPPIPDSAVECGMGDNYIYALACDQLGRIWIGHLNHGVSVFNGQKWQNYEVAGGLSKSDTLNGPLGERIFKIMVAPDFTATVDKSGPIFHDSLTNKESPVAGSVWICTNAGLSIYFPSTDSWSYWFGDDKSAGDEIGSVAFNHNGDVFIGTLNDGLEYASPGDKYTTWTHVSGPDRLPSTSTGSGLPSRYINDLLVTRNGILWAATRDGLAWSTDSAKSWSFVRGKNWARKLGLRQPNDAQSKYLLAEDFCTALTEKGTGEICVGHRAARAEVFSVTSKETIQLEYDGFLSAFLEEPDQGGLLLGDYGNGIRSLGNMKLYTAADAPSLKPSLPSGAKPPTAEFLDRVDNLLNRQSLGDVAFIGDDWRTQGNWVGHYGSSMATLCAVNSPLDHVLASDSSIQLTGALLHKLKPDDDVRHWVHEAVTEDQRVLYSPIIGIRRPAGWDDHGEAYAQDENGPGLAVDVTIPSGPHNVSAYFLNYDGHAGTNRYRDYELKARVLGSSDTASAPVSTRVLQFWGGVFKEFSVRGPKTIRLEIEKADSLNVMCAGVGLNTMWSA